MLYVLKWSLQSATPSFQLIQFVKWASDQNNCIWAVMVAIRVTLLLGVAIAASKLAE
jgi:3-methyladenine DNA glycosylase AlkC